MSSITVPIIDTDTHLSEPPDLWTSRLSGGKWRDEELPRLVLDTRRNEERWVVAGRMLTGVANWTFAGWPEYPPSHPTTMAEADPGGWDAVHRIKRMDEQGIAAEVIYPNLLGFSSHAFLAIEDAELRLQCIRAYNDYLIDFASPDPSRFILLTSLPFWDVAASVAEIERCHDLGHRGVLFASKPFKVGMPALADEHWRPIFSTAQERGLSINFHVGFQDITQDEQRAMIGARSARSDYAKLSTLSMLGLAEGMCEVLLSGVCHNFPTLKFVAVESGFGWIPFLLEAADWQWRNSGAASAYPEREMPSTYFRRQCFGTFWYERNTVRSMIADFADNIMFESDYPHPTSLSPGPASSSKTVRETVNDTLSTVPSDVVRKILYDNAAALYGLPALGH
ncbi:MAG: amidohydrolase family protein [Acidimicrobiia bacterium]